MATTNAISTYTKLIDDIRTEYNDVRISSLGDEQLRVWINRAQERISDLVQVKDEYIVGLNNEVTKYYFQDRPAITDATNATPIVLASTAHGLSNGDRFIVRGVVGNLGANGRWQASAVSANAITPLFFADISTAEADTSTVTVTTVQEHPFTTGQSVTITGVTGMTDLNSTFVATKTGVKTFTVPLTTTQTYEDGGICTASSIGSGTYTAGGRLWRDDEIPTFFKDFIRGRRTWSNTYHPEIEMRDIQWILDQESSDTNSNVFYSDYRSPSFAAINMENALRYLQVYPTPTEDQEVTMYGVVRVTARLYDTENLAASIILPSNYDAAIVAYTKLKLVEWLKDGNRQMFYQSEFNGEINILRLRAPVHTRVRVAWQ